MGGVSGMTCKTCRHPGRDDIDQALVSGEPHRSVAEQYGLSESSVFRHQEHHVPATLIAALESRELAHGENLLDLVNGLVDSALASLERAEGKGNEREVQGAIREARHSLELVGRLNGDLREANRDSSPQADAVVITKVTIVLNHGQEEPEPGKPTIEASYQVLPREAE